MNYIILIISSIILPIISLKKINPKLCINCKHFISDNDTDKYSKCSVFPLREGKINFLVNGINNDEYNYCATAREINHLCGEEAKYYKKKRVKNANLKK
jgi:hypothetical protein